MVLRSQRAYFCFYLLLLVLFSSYALFSISYLQIDYNLGQFASTFKVNLTTHDAQQIIKWSTPKETLLSLARKIYFRGRFSHAAGVILALLLFKHVFQQ